MDRVHRVALLMLWVLAGVFVGACASSPPEVPADANGEVDAVLVQGRAVYGSHCASCHGSSGGGGLGVKLNEGAVLAAYETVESQAAVVAAGPGEMPAFSERLSEVEILAVTRYTREVLQ